MWITWVQVFSWACFGLGHVVAWPTLVSLATQVLCYPSVKGHNSWQECPNDENCLNHSKLDSKTVNLICNPHHNSLYLWSCAHLKFELVQAHLELQSVAQNSSWLCLQFSLDLKSLPIHLYLLSYPYDMVLFCSLL